MTPYVQDVDFQLFNGDVLDVLAELPDESVHCVVTSPPYWNLRDYGTGLWDGGDTDCDHLAPPLGGTGKTGLWRDGRSEEARQREAERQVANRDQQFRGVCGKCGATRVDQQLGLEQTPDLYVTRMVQVFREIRRVLRDDGCLFLNLGDSHLNKQLQGVPWRVAFALQADGWWLRSDIIWAKPNPMPESVTDRPTKAHEYVFLLTKSVRYYFDAEAVREEWSASTAARWKNGGSWSPGEKDLTRTGKPATPFNPANLVPRPKPQDETLDGSEGEAPRCPDGRRATKVEGRDGSLQHRDGERWPNGGRNIRSVWEIATQPYAEAHFATFPLELPRRCIAAGCPVDGTVLDPFAGSGTTALVARNLGRRSIGIELNPAYCELAAKRLAQQSLLTEPAA